MHFARVAQFFLISKKQLYRLILYISLPLFCTTTTWNFPKLPSYTFYGGNVVLFNFFSLPFIFSLVAASISPFSHSRYKSVMLFFQRNWSPLVFIFRYSSLPVIQVNVDIEIKSKERIGFCCCCFYLWGVDARTDVPRTDDLLRTKISWMHRFT